MRQHDKGNRSSDRRLVSVSSVASILVAGIHAERSARQRAQLLPLTSVPCPITKIQTLGVVTSLPKYTPSCSNTASKRMLQSNGTLISRCTQAKRSSASRRMRVQVQPARLSLPDSIETVHCHQSELLRRQYSGHTTLTAQRDRFSTAVAARRAMTTQRRAAQASVDALQQQSGHYPSLGLQPTLA